MIHFLALKPHRKVDLHNRLKKGRMGSYLKSYNIDTIADKHCENLLNHLDPVLLQVAEPSAQDRTIYNLKASYYAEVKVINWNPDVFVHVTNRSIPFPNILTKKG